MPNGRGLGPRIGREHEDCEHFVGEFYRSVGLNSVDMDEDSVDIDGG